MVLSQISNKFHRFQQITREGKEVNVQHNANGKNNYDILLFLGIYVFLYTYMYFSFSFFNFLFLLATNIHYFVSKVCKFCMSSNQVSRF